MGRYGQNRSRKSGRSRYAGLDDRPLLRAKRSNANALAIGIVVVAAVAGGFFLVKLGGQALDPQVTLVPFLDKLFKSTAEVNMAKPQPAAKLAEQQPNAPETGATAEIQPYELKEDVVLPALDSSDGPVRDALTAAMPGLAAYLNTGQLIRKYMRIANDFSQGIRVAKHFTFLKLSEPFAVENNAGGLVMAANSYRRYDSLAQAIAAINEPELIAIYKKFRPLMLQVFAEYSYPDGHNLDDIFIDAGRQILAAPVVEGPIKVVKRGVFYQFADPELEALNPVHKQMLRMGAENTRLIQAKVRALLAELVNPKAEESPTR